MGASSVTGVGVGSVEKYGGGKGPGNLRTNFVPMQTPHIVAAGTVLAAQTAVATVVYLGGSPNNSAVTLTAFPGTVTTIANEANGYAQGLPLSSSNYAVTATMSAKGTVQVIKDALSTGFNSFQLLPTITGADEGAINTIAWSGTVNGLTASGGTGYVAGDVLTVVTGGTGGTLTVGTVSASGAITAATVTTGGLYYMVGVAGTTGGTGTGALVSITGITSTNPTTCDIDWVVTRCGQGLEVSKNWVPATGGNSVLAQ